MTRWERLKRWWCRLNDHHLGERSVGYDPGANGWGIIVYTHTCLCELYFIDDWHPVDIRRADS